MQNTSEEHWAEWKAISVICPLSTHTHKHTHHMITATHKCLRVCRARVRVWPLYHSTPVFHPVCTARDVAPCRSGTCLAVPVVIMEQSSSTLFLLPAPWIPGSFLESTPVRKQASLPGTLCCNRRRRRGKESLSPFPGCIPLPGKLFRNWVLALRLFKAHFGNCDQGSEAYKLSESLSCYLVIDALVFQIWVNSHR